MNPGGPLRANSPAGDRVPPAGTNPDADTTEGWITTWALLALLIAGALFGLFILFLHFPSWNDYHRNFARRSAFLLWAGLICAQTGFWAAVLVWLFPSLRRHWTARSCLSTEVLLSTLLIAVITSVFAVASSQIRHTPAYIPGHTWRLEVLTAAGLLVGLVAAWGIWLVRDELRQLGQQPLATESEKTTVLKTFLTYTADLDRFLGTLGVILGLLVLSTAAHRQMVLSYATFSAYHKQPDKHGRIIAAHVDYGFQLVLVYGLFFTILVAAIYLPTHLTRSRVAARIRDAYFPAVAPDSPEWISQSAKREQLAGVLDLANGPLSQFKTAVPILTPLIGGLLGLLLR